MTAGTQCVGNTAIAVVRTLIPTTVTVPNGRLSTLYRRPATLRQNQYCQTVKDLNLKPLMFLSGLVLRFLLGAFSKLSVSDTVSKTQYKPKVATYLPLCLVRASYICGTGRKLTDLAAL